MKEENNKNILRFCSRCGSNWCELGRILKYGKYYPPFTIKTKDGEIKKYPEDFEIIEAVCKKCSIDLYDYQYRNEIGKTCSHWNMIGKSCENCHWCFCNYCSSDRCTYCGHKN